MLKKRLKNISAIFAAAALALCIRLLYIPLQHGESYQTMALVQREKTIPVKAIRGAVYDRHGKPFTDTKSRLLYINREAKISKHPDEGLFSFESTKRQSELAKHLIGYTNTDGSGGSGLELLYDKLLSTDKKDTVSYIADAAGGVIDGIGVNKDGSKIKNSLKLTLDKDIQAICEQVMDKYIKKGACVVLDSASFDVLAMVSRPDFDNENVVKYLSSANGELLNRALMGYNAGSVFKIVTAAAAIEKNIDADKREYDCRGIFYLDDGNSFKCHKAEGHGIINLDTAFAKSCNCTFYLLGIECGGKHLISEAEKFGLGKKLLNARLGEFGGNLPKKDDYSTGELLNLSIGQGEILITPLQCAAMAATIANGGIRRDVNIIDRVCTSDGRLIDKRNKNSYKAIEEDTAKLIADMMRQCTSDGTAAAMLSPDMDIAGKTGSAESGWRHSGSNMVHGWFCGFFPTDKPQYAVAILCEDGKSGSARCVEPFGEIYKKINEIYRFK